MEYKSADLPVIVSWIFVWKVPLLVCNCIFNSTLEPNKSPLSSAFCNCAKDIVTLTASLLRYIACVTPPLATVQTLGKPPMGLEFIGSLDSMPGITSWLFVPKRASNTTLWKLKSASVWLLLLALALSIGVLLRNISFCAAV